MTSAEPAQEMPSPGSVRLRWLKIFRYRNVRPGTELRFDDNFNILLGKNGSGKTTLLRLLAAVISSEFRLLSDPYELEYLIDISGIQLAVRAWTEDVNGPAIGAGGPRPVGGSSLAHLCDVSVQASGGGLLAVRVDPRGGELFVDGKSMLKRNSIWGYEAPAFQRLLSLLAIDFSRENISEILREKISPGVRDVRDRHSVLNDLGETLRRFDESLDTFREITGTGTPETDVLHPPHLVAVGDAQGSNASMIPNLGTNTSLWRALSAGKKASDEDIVIGSNELLFLDVFATSTGQVRAEARLSFTEKKVFGPDANWHYRSLKFRFTRPDGSIFSHEQLSYGQKRLLAFLYYLAVNEYAVVADELVNGLHHEWIQLCLDQIGLRQAFLTSQNPLLLDYLPPGSVEQTQRRYLLCRSVPAGTREELIWENMPLEDAERFFRAYEVGVRQASDVLLSKGLW